MAKMRAQTAGLTGLTTYFTIADANGQVWNGSAIVARSTAARNAGGITATGYDDGTYDADIPATLPASDVPYVYTLWQRLTGSPLESDTALAGPGLLPWNGTAQVGAIRLVDGAISDNSFTVPDEEDEPVGVVGWIRRIFSKAYNRRTRNRNSGAFTLYASDSVTPIEVSTHSVASNVDTVTKGAAPS
jgi:hypothetical protein